MHRFEILTNDSKDPEHLMEREVQTFLEEHGAACVTQQADGFSPECLLVLGGDGTVLRAAERVKESGIPILGFNLGTLGYLAEIERNAWKEALLQLLDGSYTIEDRMMIEGGRVVKPGESSPWMLTEPIHQALNDIVIFRSGALRVVNYDVYVNGKFLNTYHADGMIICTPTGSTAYNLSAGGPIVEPGAEMIVLTPICAHQINIRSIVLSATDQIEIVIEDSRGDSELAAEAVYDGNERVELRNGERFAIRKSDRVTRLVKLGNRSFLETLRVKMQ
jgi:NAD+ kinase